MKRAPTFFLKIVLILMTLVILALCIFALPPMGKGITAEYPSVPYLKYFNLIGYAIAIPILIAIYQAFKLLTYIDRGGAFSEVSIKALKNIKYCAIAASIILAAGMPFAFGVADADDAPGLIIFWMIIICSPLVIAVFAAMLQKLVQNAIAIKSENDLTI